MVRREIAENAAVAGRLAISNPTKAGFRLISELVYGMKTCHNDPVRYSFAHGGKDGYPYPVDRVTYDKSISPDARTFNPLILLSK